MDRLTYKNKFNKWEASGLNISRFSIGYKDTPSTVEGKLIDKLAEYEDLEEQREKGCDFYNNYDFSNAKVEVDKYGARILLGLCNTKFSKEEQFKLCPMCGRKLSD